MSSTNVKVISVICDRDNKKGDGTYKVNLGNLGFNSFSVCSLKSCTFRNLLYNVRGSGVRKNNIFYFSLDGTPTEIEVPEGFYSIYELLDYLRPQLESILAGSGIIPLPTLTTLDYSTISGKVTMLIDGNGAGTPFELEGKSNPKSVNFLLGNNEDVALDTLTPEAYVFDSIISLQADDRVHLVSNAVAPNGGITNKSLTGGSRNLSLLRALPVGDAFGNIVEYESQDIDAEALSYPLAQNFTELDFALQDIYGNIIDLQNSELTIELLVWRTL
jgi:hypothetical protein